MVLLIILTRIKSSFLRKNLSRSFLNPEFWHGLHECKTYRGTYIFKLEKALFNFKYLTERYNFLRSLTDHFFDF